MAIRILAFSGSSRRSPVNQRVLDIAAAGAAEAGAQVTALLIASPEYNRGYTPLLKNAIDSASRPGATPGPNAFTGKLAAMVSASLGLLGGIRSQVSLLPMLHKLGVYVVLASFTLGSAFQLFDQDGALTDSAAHAALHGVDVAMAEAVARFAALEAA
jgi:chromate reductase, NAD(P)H dehydrogenase (quinone)